MNAFKVKVLLYQSEVDLNAMADQQPSAPNIVIPTDRVPAAAYQAIYHHLTGKTETINRLFRLPAIVTPESLEDFSIRIQQALEQYQVVAQSTEVALIVRDGPSYRFSSFERFRISNINILNNSTRSVFFAFDFLIVLPTTVDEARDVAQRYRISFNADPRGVGDLPSHLRHAPYELLDTLGERSSLGVSIEYTDFSVGRSFLALAEEWVNGLEKDDDLTLGEKNYHVAVWGFGRLISSLPFLVVLGGIAFEPEAYSNLFTPIRYLLCVGLFTIAAFIVGESLGRSFYTNLSNLRPILHLKFTGADSAAYQKILSKRKSARGSIGIAMTGVLLAGVVSFFSNLLTAIFLQQF